MLPEETLNSTHTGTASSVDPGLKQMENLSVLLPSSTWMKQAVAWSQVVMIRRGKPRESRCKPVMQPSIISRPSFVSPQLPTTLPVLYLYMVQPGTGPLCVEAAGQRGGRILKLETAQ